LIPSFARSTGKHRERHTLRRDAKIRAVVAYKLPRITAYTFALAEQTSR
jgi:hypothetical protein